VLHLDSTAAADIAHHPIHVVGYEGAIDPGHIASIRPAGVTSPTSDHLLFI
jgi:hypothetical protein